MEPSHEAVYLTEREQSLTDFSPRIALEHLPDAIIAARSLSLRRREEAWQAARGNNDPEASKLSRAEELEALADELETYLRGPTDEQIAAFLNAEAADL